MTTMQWRSGLVLVLATTAGLLSACADSRGLDNARLGPPSEFGRAVRQDVAAQIADPDPAWKNTPSPPTDGSRVGLAVLGYKTDTVKTPDAQSTK